MVSFSQILQEKGYMGSEAALVHPCTKIRWEPLPGQMYPTMTFDYKFLRIGSHPCICMFTLQIHPKITKSKKASDLGADPVILNGDGKIELLDSLAGQSEFLDLKL